MSVIETLADHETLVRALRTPAAWPQPVSAVEVIETHISTVLLVDVYAYKLKKPVVFPFLDFSTLAARAFYCAEEVRLNRRTAPQICLDVVPIAGPLAAPRVGGEGEPIEYAVRMRRFDPAQTLDRRAERGALDETQIDALALAIAQLHRAAAPAPDRGEFGTPATVHRWTAQNLFDLRGHVLAAADRARIDELAAWSEREFRRRRSLIERRRGAGCVREGHGDLHLGNVVLLDGAPVLFDALEFNPELRFIDVINDVAFVFMDLADHGFDALAWRLLGRYLEASGDYEGVALLGYYAVYRALVRAHVARIRAQQSVVAAQTRVRLHATFEQYLALAERLAGPPAPMLVVMTGLSGSGKSTVAQHLAQRLGGLRVRSDIERKRLAGPSEGFLYSKEMTVRTYDRLQQIAGHLLDAGVTAVIDAASLKSAERRALAAVAQSRGVRCEVVCCEAPFAVLCQRVAKRAAVGNDPSDATLVVLEQQREWREPAAAGEPPHRLLHTDCDAATLASRCADLALRMRRD
jgi:aminoglycoside phosphotransferase family enzyme/predicted kinase